MRLLCMLTPLKQIGFFLFIAIVVTFVGVRIKVGRKLASHLLDLPCKPRLKSGTTYSANDRSTPKAETRVCWKAPAYTAWDSCPECFRPKVINHSQTLYQIPLDLARFPRGPPRFFEPKDHVIQPLVVDYLITPRAVCRGNTCPYLLAFQLSVADRAKERDAIRATWASVAKTKLWPHANLNAEVQVVFVLAHKSSMSDRGHAMAKSLHPGQYGESYPTLKEWTHIKAEADKHGDILYLNMQDAYDNLTLKVMSGLKWIDDHCPLVKFVLKVDEDTFVNVPLLLDMLIYNEDRLEFSVLGFMYTSKRLVHRSGRWKVNPESYPLPVYPIYAAGCAYILSRYAVSNVVALSPFVPMIPIEDAYLTGILVRILGLPLMSFRNSDLMTHSRDLFWHRCHLVGEDKFVATGINRLFKHFNVWSDVVRYDGTCSKYNLMQMSCWCNNEWRMNKKDKRL